MGLGLWITVQQNCYKEKSCFNYYFSMYKKILQVEQMNPQCFWAFSVFQSCMWFTAILEALSCHNSSILFSLRKGKLFCIDQFCYIQKASNGYPFYSAQVSGYSINVEVKTPVFTILASFTVQPTIGLSRNSACSQRVYYPNNK